MGTPSAVNLAGRDLNPAPFVSTSYEYNRSGQYVIGGFLVVTLDGTLVGEDILSQMSALGMMQGGLNCVNLTIGCQGGADFLEGSGRIDNIDVSPGDQPFVASYSITIKLETVNGFSAVKADPDFLTNNCIPSAEYLSSYSEEIQVGGDGDGIALVDNENGLSKSFLKGSGSIRAACFSREVCGVPSFNGRQQALGIIEARAAALLGFNSCDSQGVLAQYGSWNKWIDTKTLTIDDGGTFEWTFDVYLSKGQCAPYAWADINTDDRVDYQNGDFERKTRTISGTIRGLSPSSGSMLGNSAGNGTRFSNAGRALGQVLPNVISGNWPGLSAGITGTRGQEPPESPCANNGEPPCYQRISSNITTSKVAGSISFTAEYADIDSCKPIGDLLIDVTIDESLPAVKHLEFIVPNIGDSIIHYMGQTPHEATVTVRGTLQGCDQAKISETINCVDQQFNLAAAKYSGWLVKEQKTTVATYSYSRMKSFIKCG
jgi:hypothetical protein